MDWHYSLNKTPQGPITEAEFAQLVRAGTIQPQTLVWREGMERWVPYQDLQTVERKAAMAPDLRTCALCHKALPADEVIHYNNVFICGACKPVFFQQLKEGSDNLGIQLWRHGKYLVVARDTVFPDRCIKCNAPANGYRLRRKLTWHHPAYYLLIFCYLVPYLVVALFVSKSAKFEVGLCEKHVRRRTHLIYLAWIVLAAIISLILAAFGGVSPVLGGAAVLLVFLDLGLVVLITNVVTPVRFDKHYIHLSGVCRKFLENLPEWIINK